MYIQTRYNLNIKLRISYYVIYYLHIICDFAVYRDGLESRNPREEKERQKEDVIYILYYLHVIM